MEFGSRAALSFFAPLADVLASFAVKFLTAEFADDAAKILVVASRQRT